MEKTKIMQGLDIKTGIKESILKNITGLLRDSGAYKAVIYGSRARGDFNDTSDIDIAYWGVTNETKLWLDIGETPTIHRVDLVNFDTLTNEKLKQNILRDGIELRF